MSITIKEALEAARAQYNNYLLYNRKEAFPLLGFKNSKSLTNWLRANDFIDYDDDPKSYFIEQNFMEVKVTYIPAKTIYTPLFTKKGIEYFKVLLADDAELQKVVEEIKSQHKYYHIPVI